MTEELGVLVRPVCPTHVHQHLDQLVADEGRKGGVVGDQVIHQEVPKFGLLGCVQGDPHVGHQILGVSEGAWV